jgi:hypothetical protein
MAAAVERTDYTAETVAAALLAALARPALATEQQAELLLAAALAPAE